jgi:hypothetical protein
VRLHRVVGDALRVLGEGVPLGDEVLVRRRVDRYKELANQGVKATDIPVVAFSVGEEELAGIDTKPAIANRTGRTGCS